MDARRLLRVALLPCFVAAPGTLLAVALAAASPVAVAQDDGKKGSQDDKQQGDKKDAEAKTVVTPLGEVRVLEDKEARDVVARFKKLVLSRSARSAKKRSGGTENSLVTRLEEVEAAGRVQHKSLVPLLRQVMLTDPSDAVRTKAAESLGAQPPKEAVKTALVLMDDKSIRQRGSLAGPMIKLLSYYGAPPSFWKEMRRRFLDLSARAQQELFEHVGRTKDWEFVELMLEHIDPPAPANVDDPSNPPASYWKARWEQWSQFKPQLREACEKLFGRTFETAKELRDWIAAEGGLKKVIEKRS